MVANTITLMSATLAPAAFEDLDTFEKTNPVMNINAMMRQVMACTSNRAESDPQITAAMKVKMVTNTAPYLTVILHHSRKMWSSPERLLSNRSQPTCIRIGGMRGPLVRAYTEGGCLPLVHYPGPGQTAIVEK